MGALAGSGEVSFLAQPGTRVAKAITEIKNFFMFASPLKEVAGRILKSQVARRRSHVGCQLSAPAFFTFVIWSRFSIRHSKFAIRTSKRSLICAALNFNGISCN